MTADEYLEMITEPAKTVCRQRNLPYACCVAQGAIESSWGNDGIGNGGFNLFGRKYGGIGDFVEVPTQEDDGTGNLYTITAKFQSYGSIDEAISDWCDLMEWEQYKPFADQFQEDGDVENFVRGIADIYATDIHYGDKIMETITACDL